MTAVPAVPAAPGRAAAPPGRGPAPGEPGETTFAEVLDTTQARTAPAEGLTTNATPIDAASADAGDVAPGPTPAPEAVAVAGGALEQAPGLEVAVTAVALPALASAVPGHGLACAEGGAVAQGAVAPASAGAPDLLAAPDDATAALVRPGSVPAAQRPAVRDTPPAVPGGPAARVAPAPAGARPGVAASEAADGPAAVVPSALSPEPPAPAVVPATGAAPSAAAQPPVASGAPAPGDAVPGPAAGEPAPVAAAAPVPAVDGDAPAHESLPGDVIAAEIERGPRAAAVPGEAARAVAPGRSETTPTAVPGEAARAVAPGRSETTPTAVPGEAARAVAAGAPAVAPAPVAHEAGLPAVAPAARADVPVPVAATPAATTPAAMAPAFDGALTPAHRAAALERAQGLLELAQRHGMSRARLTLRPVELGGLEVQLRTTAAGLSATVRADEQTTAAALHEAAGELRRSLEEAGVVVDRLDVTWSGQDAQHDRHGRRAHGEAESAGTARGASADDADADALVVPLDLPSTTPRHDAGAFVDVSA